MPSVKYSKQIDIEKLQVEIPKPFSFLFEKHRFKVAYGGRGSGKSWSFALALIIRALQEKLFILCAREIQKSIADSVHKLLKDTIDRLNLTKYFTVTNRKIFCKLTGSEFSFEGLYRNVSRIRSIEGVDICWVEEAENVSEDSWNQLIPSIRKDGSEIWVTFNPKYPDDATYKWFVIDTPKDAIVRKVNFDENPFFPDVLRQELEEDKRYRPSIVKNKWYGEPIGYGMRVWQEFTNKEFPAGHIRIFEFDKIVCKSKFIMSMDPAMHYYPACIWIALIPKNDKGEFYKWIYAEWPMYDTLGCYFHEARRSIQYTGTLADMAREIYIQDGTSQYGIKIDKRYIDTRFVKGAGSASFYSTSTLGLLSEFAKRENGGLMFELPSEKSIDMAIVSIRKDLQYNTLAPVNQMNEPLLYVAPWCTNMIMALENHRLEEGSEKESDKYKDFSDALKIAYAGISTLPLRTSVSKDEFEEEYERYSYDWRNVPWMAR